jgi:protein tyrosine/serine phosphatase
MVENEQMNKQGREGSKSARLRRILVLLICVVVVCAGLYFLEISLDDVGIFFAGGRLNTEAKVSGAKQWARRLELPGVKNFHKVSEGLYRGAQPSAEGMRRLKGLGIKTVVSLRSFHSDRDEIGDIDLAYEHMYMKAWHAEDKEVVWFLKIVTDPNRMPVLVHCQRGADRTGTMCAIYKVAVEGWSKDEAIEEMTKGGFGFYSGFENLVEYIDELDVDKIKARAGLKR